MKHSYHSKKFFLTSIILFCSFYLISCEKFLEVDDPNNQISQSMVFKDKGLAYAALSDVYTNLRANTLLNGSLYGVGTLMGCYTDELNSVSNQSLDFKSFFDLSVQQNTTVVNTIWVNAYKQIYAVNNIIEGVGKSTAYLDQQTIDQILGEAYFIRGFLHFYLVNLYGDVPYITTTDYLQNQSVSRQSVDNVYVHIEEDYQKADQYLTDQYPTANRTRINRSGVRLALARLYLYKQEWAKASLMADLVIQNPLYTMEQDISKTFLKDSKSAIWQFMPLEAGVNTLEGQYYIFVTLPPQNVVLSQNLLDSFEPGDQRKQKWTKTLSNAAMSYAYPYKYTQNNKTSSSLEFSIVLRVEEAYLISAEAENELGNTQTAINRLNQLRQRAGLAGLGGLSQQQVRTAVMDERRHELFTEFGHRFFDLKRKGLLNTYMATVKSSWKDYMSLLPLPENELIANPSLKPQNNGY
ncbi:RagB/SusD family nutrient uptake outer membrane protein [Epilithonimonas mollis]|uniref:SusD family protein n=1 Tax=Epilithonimonas mollis TaxID=216903 RepID=A0A1M6UI27_9FLAO|nr:RagB/SusD family nutrient uptake outer membrane protein [Epilithonimonas mollis]SHK68872.1 SusD family protein [Epilithonimonas mollis]